MTCGEVSLEEDDLFPGPNKMYWHVPQWLDAKSSFTASEIVEGPIAKRTYAAGEVVELSTCLLMAPKDMAKTFLHAFLYPVDLSVVTTAKSGFKLWPHGWGLLYRQSDAYANMVVEHHFAVAPAAPTEANVDPSEIEAELQQPSHWLCFRANRVISEGEELFVPSRSGQLSSSKISMSIYDACAAAWKEGQGILKEDDSLDDQWIASELPPPEVVELIEQDDDVRIVATSPVHGVGVFAARDIQKGEVLEVDPMLPLPLDCRRGVLGEYTFEPSINTYENFELMPIGLGAVYNHSDSPNMEHCNFADMPYIEIFYATEFIPKGREICHDYGDEYFAARDIEQKVPKHEVPKHDLHGGNARQRRVLRCL